MKFTLTITLGTDEMNTAQHVAKALRGIAEILDENCNGNLVECNYHDAGAISDWNGEDVGEWRIGDATKARR